MRQWGEDVQATGLGQGVVHSRQAQRDELDLTSGRFCHVRRPRRRALLQRGRREPPRPRQDCRRVPSRRPSRESLVPLGPDAHGRAGGHGRCRRALRAGGGKVREGRHARGARRGMRHGRRRSHRAGRQLDVLRRAGLRLPVRPRRRHHPRLRALYPASRRGGFLAGTRPGCRMHLHRATRGPRGRHRGASRRRFSGYLGE